MGDTFAKGGSDGGAGGACMGPTTFEALFKIQCCWKIMHGDCGFQLSTKAIVTNTRCHGLQIVTGPAKIVHLSKFKNIAGF